MSSCFTEDKFLFHLGQFLSFPLVPPSGTTFQKSSKNCIAIKMVSFLIDPRSGKFQIAHNMLENLMVTIPSDLIKHASMVTT